MFARAVDGFYRVYLLEPINDHFWTYTITAHDMYVPIIFPLMLEKIDDPIKRRNLTQTAGFH
jgi:hypothetical protein